MRAVSGWSWSLSVCTHEYVCMLCCMLCMNVCRHQESYRSLDVRRSLQFRCLHRLPMYPRHTSTTTMNVQKTCLSTSIQHLLAPCSLLHDRRASWSNLLVRQVKRVQKKLCLMVEDDPTPRSYPYPSLVLLRTAVIIILIMRSRLIHGVSISAA